jgi:hypothetical protein
MCLHAFPLAPPPMEADIPPEWLEDEQVETEREDTLEDEEDGALAFLSAQEAPFPVQVEPQWPELLWVAGYASREEIASRLFGDAAVGAFDFEPRAPPTGAVEGLQVCRARAPPASAGAGVARRHAPCPGRATGGGCGVEQARAEAQQCREEKARLQAECSGQGGSRVSLSTDGSARRALLPGGSRTSPNVQESPWPRGRSSATGPLDLMDGDGWPWKWNCATWDRYRPMSVLELMNCPPMGRGEGWSPQLEDVSYEGIHSPSGRTE